MTMYFNVDVCRNVGQFCRDDAKIKNKICRIAEKHLFSYAKKLKEVGRQRNETPCGWGAAGIVLKTASSGLSLWRARSEHKTNYERESIPRIAALQR